MTSRKDLADDPRVTFLPFTTPVEGNDKWRKLAQLCDHLPALGTAAGYAMTFDADDLAHPGLVSEIISREARGGYLAQTGYVYDKSADALALADEEAPQLLIDMATLTGAARVARCGV